MDDCKTITAKNSTQAANKIVQNFGGGGAIIMPLLKTILIIDDNTVNRIILTKILSKNYNVLEAENGYDAVTVLDKNFSLISAVMLDIVMPVMDGYEFLKHIGDDERYKNLPVIVTTDNNDNENEIKALSLGAWDFISKPYNSEIINFRLKNSIERSQLTALKQLQYLSEYDNLTGTYNKAKFFSETRTMIDANREETFVMFRIDIDRFQLVNSFFGTDEGDKLLIFIGECLKNHAELLEKSTYGRMESDVFCFCMPYDESNTKFFITQAKKVLAEYNPNYDVVPSIGVYIIDDNTVSVEKMYTRAALAAKICKGNYVDYYAFYNETMSSALAREQEIVNDMNFALDNEQFEIYFQPQYNIQNNLACGAEALVRWIHPKKGLLSPGEFIPIFEKNGFIIKLDYYVWERVCKYLRGWLDKGLNTFPISVNVSRVNLYNPKLSEILINLIKRYDLEPSFLNLELTESAYSDNPVAMGETISRLQSYGFTIMMDDFGSGYSSLNILKDIAVDVLKIDMRFLSKTKIAGRGENIIASVVRMAKWLNIPVVAEGVETLEQVEFLRSVGCDYAQGYYFARPMPFKKYEELYEKQPNISDVYPGSKFCQYGYDELFTSNPSMESLFGSTMLAAALYEFVGSNIELIRVNDAYYEMLGYNDMALNSLGFLDLVDEKYRKMLTDAFSMCVETKTECACEYLRRHTDGRHIWIHTKLKYVSQIGSKFVLIGTLTDITLKKEIDIELQKYRTSLLSQGDDTRTILIADDSETDRAILKNILSNEYRLLEAESGSDAFEVLNNNKNSIDLILLDITISNIDGKKFLELKNGVPCLDGIPVIMLTPDNSPKQQINTLFPGVNDYIVKPFIPEVLIRRIKNVLQYGSRFIEMVKQYNSISEQVKMDLMTGLLNRSSVESLIEQHLKESNEPCAMLMLDIDNFKKINDNYGHIYGDKVICAVAEKLKTFFRKDDIVARMGGDEFAVFMKSISSAELAESRAWKLCRSMSEIKIDGTDAAITCSIGIAVSSEGNDTIESLYTNSDKALYIAKYSGKGSVSVFGKETKFDLPKWINDAEGILGEINDGIYVCDKNTYDILYLNDYMCRFAHAEHRTCIGKKCYEVLMHRTTPCEFCSLSKSSTERVYTRIFKFSSASETDIEKTYLMRGKEVNWCGIAAHMEIAVDITDINNIIN